MSKVYKATFKCFDELGNELPKSPDWEYTNYFDTAEDAEAFCRKAAEQCVSVYRSRYPGQAFKEDVRPTETALYRTDEVDGKPFDALMFCVGFKVEKLESVGVQAAYDDMLAANRKFFDAEFVEGYEAGVVKTKEDEENELLENEARCREAAAKGEAWPPMK